jgi:hypothetical protein
MPFRKRGSLYQPMHMILSRRPLFLGFGMLLVPWCTLYQMDEFYHWIATEERTRIKSFACYMLLATVVLLSGDEKDTISNLLIRNEDYQSQPSMVQDTELKL